MTITAITKDKYITEVSNSKHKIVADEPVEIGGDDTGLRPKELLQASLA